jgi:hypothetical protein
MPAQASNTNITTIVFNWTNGFMIFSFISFSPLVDFALRVREEAKNVAGEMSSA